MSWSMDLFFNSNVGFDQTKHALEELFALSFREGKSSVEHQLNTHTFALKILLFRKHTFDDEDRLSFQFSGYSHWLSFSPIYNIHGSMEYCRAISIYWGKLLHHTFGWSLIVVDDLEHVQFEANSSAPMIANTSMR